MTYISQRYSVSPSPERAVWYSSDSNIFAMVRFLKAQRPVKHVVTKTFYEVQFVR